MSEINRATFKWPSNEKQDAEWLSQHLPASAKRICNKKNSHNLKTELESLTSMTLDSINSA